MTTTDYVDKEQRKTKKELMKSQYAEEFNKLNDTEALSFLHIIFGLQEFLSTRFQLKINLSSDFEYIISNITDDTFNNITKNNISQDNYIDGVVFLGYDDQLVSGDFIDEVSTIIFYQSKSGKSGKLENDLKSFSDSICNILSNNTMDNDKITNNVVLEKISKLKESPYNFNVYPLYIEYNKNQNIQAVTRERLSPYIDSLNSTGYIDTSLDEIIFDMHDLYEINTKQTAESTLKINILQKYSYPSNNIEAYITFPYIHDYIYFINRNKKLESFALDEGLFLQNVRANIGNNLINKQIYRTFLKGPSEFDGDMWWLSNGVTIIAKKMIITGNHLKLIEPSIINGQQTSRQLANVIKIDMEEFQKNNPSYSPWTLMVKIFIADYDDTNISKIIAKIINGLNSQSAISKNSIDLLYPETKKLQDYLKSNHCSLEIRAGEFSQSIRYKQTGANKNIITIEELVQYTLSSDFFKTEDKKSIDIGSIRSGKARMVSLYNKRIFKNTSIPHDQWLLFFKAVINFNSNITFTPQEEKAGMKYLKFAIFRLVFFKYRSTDPTTLENIFINQEIINEMKTENLDSIKEKLYTEMKKQPNTNWDQESKTSRFQTMLSNIKFS